MWHPLSSLAPCMITEPYPITTSSSIMHEYRLQFGSMVTFLPMLTDGAIPCGSAQAVLMTVPSPMELKWPILTALKSALITTLYHTVAHLLIITSPTIQKHYKRVITNWSVRCNPGIINVWFHILKWHDLTMSWKFLSIGDIIFKSTSESIHSYKR